MNTSYQTPSQAENFNNFLESADGKFQKELVFNQVTASLKDTSSKAKILDLGCGSGWLTNQLTLKGHQAIGCDAGKAQIELANKLYPENKFLVADLQKALPFPENEFDVIITSLVLCDIENQAAALNEIFRILKPNGKFVNIIPNPYYTMPVTAWKKGFWGRLFKQKPRPTLSPYFSFLDSPREFKWRGNITRRFHTLSEQINHILIAGFILTRFKEPRSETDTNKFSRQYQVYRFPLYLVIEAKKPSPV
ncbi:MAG: methyltransferase domain-containing protein [Candidatus Doudnabacteria bacterium]|nr:methyltransferase domain-containing protein [Candidatus Doudnabacteria bacterium]